MTNTTIQNYHSGSFYIKITSKETGKWILMYQSFKDGVKSQKSVEEFIYQNLGLTKELSIEEARKRVKRINKDKSLERKGILNSGKRVVAIQSVDENLFPKADIQAFEIVLTKKNRLNGATEEHLKKQFSHFNFIQDMVKKKLKCQPMYYSDKSEEVYEWLQKEKVSINYAERLIAMLNMWGLFVSKRYGTFFEPVKRPKGMIRTNIMRLQKTKKGKDSDLGVRTESLPMSEELLAELKHKMPKNFYNWVYLSFWFGLRPSEVDSLKSKQFWKIGMDRISKAPFIEIYQTKLSSIDEDKRWKKIPIIFPEQQECLTIIKSLEFSRPHPKTLRRYTGDNYTLYAGRKNFVDLCLSRGQDLNNISLWCGHKKISTTWAHYKDKDSVKFTMTDEISKNLKKTGSK